jgi:hypothetical protein
MGTLDLWIEVIAGVRSLYELVHGKTDFYSTFRMHKQLVLDHAERAQVCHSHYSADDLSNLANKIEACRELMLHFGKAGDRYPWLCALFREIAECGDGTLPDIDEWPRLFDRLGCGCMEKDQELIDGRPESAQRPGFTKRHNS